MLVIYIPSVHRHISIHQYCQIWKRVKENPETEFKQGISAWWPQKGKDIARDFTRGVHDRINGRAKGLYRFVKS